MSRVFINYRTGDEEASATLIERELSRRFGSDEIFRASKSIKPGDDYERELLRAVRRCDLLLAIIGPGWSDATGRSGGRALDDPGDWTRREIAEAFAYGARVIPVLVNNRQRLPEEELPDDLAPLAKCQYRRLSHRNADADIEQIVRTVADAVPRLVDRRDEEGGAGSGARPPGGPGHPSGGGTARNTVGDVRGLARQAGDVTDRRSGGIGDIGINHGTVIDSMSGFLHTGSGSQVTGGTQVQGDLVQGDQVQGGVNFKGENQGGINLGAQQDRTRRNSEPHEDGAR
ncbi:toll/interleukin-1 receptor domain-containing protein [Nocardiopsis sediminis]|uniref:Toll/interleukin-1 receptor domain-containing protein n=1 Tax=Nocardiopsis sediminis TaxID=1778267 RepID=A0ABV8FGJ7_9ACTN